MGDYINLDKGCLIVIQDGKVAMISKQNRIVTIDIKYIKCPEIPFQDDNALKSITFKTDSAVITDHPSNHEVVKKAEEIFKLLGLDAPTKKCRKSKRGI